MKKRFLTLVVALSAGALLVACSNNKTETSKSSSTEKSSVTKKSSTEKSSSSESKTSASSSASTSTKDITPAILVTDEEFDAAKTVGDFKALYSKMVDNYLKYVDEIGNKIPTKEAKDAYNEQIKSVKPTLEDAKQKFNTALSTLGDDSVEIPEDARKGALQALKTARDQAQNMLDAAQSMIE